MTASDFSGTLELEARWFWDSTTFGLAPKRASVSSGVVFMPELNTDFNNNTSLRVVGFYRHDDLDSERTHADLREAYIVHYRSIPWGEFEIRVGVDRVFWGVAESNHLIDIVNQTDLVEDPDEEDKLGQPMIHLTLSTDSGVFELFGLPWHRQRTFPGVKGRLGLPLPIDADSVIYESNDQEKHFDLAFRYSHSFGSIDAGFTSFLGTNREPFIRPDSVLDIPKVFYPIYTQIGQFGIDLRLQQQGWLFKFEGLHRTGALNRLGLFDDYFAFVGGTEYTLYSLFGTVADLTIVTEWSFDERKQQATTRFNNDIFLASRLILNDFQGTLITLSLLIDNENSGTVAGLEFSRRISGSLSLALELVRFDSIAAEDILYPIQNDSYLQLNLSYGF